MDQGKFHISTAANLVHKMLSIANDIVESCASPVNLNALFILFFFVCLFVCLFNVCVCLFRGNIRGERPYEQGTPCSRCPSNKPSCEANLCAQQATNTGAPSSLTTEATTESPSQSTTEDTTEAPTSTSVVLVPSFLGLSVLSLINTLNFVII